VQLLQQKILLLPSERRFWWEKRYAMGQVAQFSGEPTVGILEHFQHQQETGYALVRSIVFGALYGVSAHDCGLSVIIVAGI
jgi:hypothetical protein